MRSTQKLLRALDLKRMREAGVCLLARPRLLISLPLSFEIYASAGPTQANPPFDRKSQFNTSITAHHDIFYRPQQPTSIWTWRKIEASASVFMLPGSWEISWAHPVIDARLSKMKGRIPPTSEAGRDGPQTTLGNLFIGWKRSLHRKVLASPSNWGESN